MLMFASALPESIMARLGKIYVGKPLNIKSRKELLETVRPSQRKFLRADTGDMPEIPATTEIRRLPLTLQPHGTSVASV
jgi:hypothetical protein